MHEASAQCGKSAPLGYGYKLACIRKGKVSFRYIYGDGCLVSMSTSCYTVHRNVYVAKPVPTFRVMVK
jgi:hypothetical protein